MRERTYTSQDGLRLFYRTFGDPRTARTALLCLPGLTRNSTDFLDLGARLETSHYVVSPDLRGRGRSDYDPDWRHYDGAVHLNDIRHLLVVENLHKVVVVGTSMGGLLAMAMGAAMPTVLRGVILNDVGPDLDSGGTGRILRYIAEDRPQPDWDAAIDHLKQILPTLSFDTERDWRRFAEGTYRAGDDGLLHFDWDVALARPLQRPGYRPPPLWPLFRSISHVPILAIRGGVSDVLSAETLGRMAEVHPDFRSTELDGVGHAPSLNEPQAVTAIDDFLSDH